MEIQIQYYSSQNLLTFSSVNYTCHKINSPQNRSIYFHLVMRNQKIQSESSLYSSKENMCYSYQLCQPNLFLGELLYALLYCFRLYRITKQFYFQLSLSNQNKLQLIYSNSTNQMQDKDDSIQVLIRIKPGQCDDTLTFSDNQIQLDKYSFGFDRVFPPATNQEEIFDAVGRRLLSNTLEGYNSCVFVYGQTGSGKTFTMIGAENGLMQRSFNELFYRLDALSNAQCLITCSYFQIYNQQIIDLLDTKRQKKLNIRQDTKKGVFVQNLTEQSVLTAEKLNQCLYFGLKNRHVGETMMNRQSSRSHSIFTVSLSLRIQTEDGKKVLKTPKLHFVDLAGSQRQKLTAASGDRLKQAGNINKSLTTLGMVINALASQKKRTHIPYRDSKLTCLLKDSLGGNSKTFIIATIASSISCFQETLSTLNFANRAKMVKVKALINQENLSTNLDLYKQQIRRLKEQIMMLKKLRKIVPKNTIQKENNHENLQSHFHEINSKISIISEQLSKTTCSPAFETLLENIEKGRHKNQDVMANQEDEEVQSDAIIQYLNSNYELLSQVNTKVSQYLKIKQDLRMTAISGKMELQDLKTPSKDQRMQYDEALTKKTFENNQLLQQIRSLKNLLNTKDLQILQLQNTVNNIKDTQREQSELVQTYQQSLFNKQKQVISLRSKAIYYQEQNTRLNNTKIDLEKSNKQIKELYLFSQEKLQSEIYFKNKAQSQLKTTSARVCKLEEQMKLLKEKFQNEIEHLQIKIEELENQQCQLRQEISVLEGTIQFHQKKVAEFKEKLQKTEENQQTLKKEKNQILLLAQDLKNKNQQTYRNNQQLKRKLRQVSNTYEICNQQLKDQKIKSEQMKQSYQMLLDQQRRRYQDLNRQYNLQKQSYVKLQIEFEQKNQEFVSRENTTHNQIKQLQQIIEQKNQEIKTNRQIIVQVSNEKESLLTQNSIMFDKNNELEESLQLEKQKNLQYENKIKELENIVQSSRDLREQNENLKKSYQDVVKDNYKLKAYKDGKIGTSDELMSKVQYYEEKFQLMSIQYKKATASVKKLKEKEMQQLKTIKDLQQSARYLKMSQFEESCNDETMKALQQQNKDLKKQLSELTPHQLAFHQQEKTFKQKIRDILTKYAPTKQEIFSRMQIEDLLVNWQKIETECRKRLQSISNSIQKQQKLKSQNNFILKENIYLKEKLSSVEKQMQMSAIASTRKIRKSDSVIDNK